VTVVRLARGCWKEDLPAELTSIWANVRAMGHFLRFVPLLERAVLTTFKRFTIVVPHRWRSIACPTYVDRALIVWFCSLSLNWIVSPTLAAGNEVLEDAIVSHHGLSWRSKPVIRNLLRAGLQYTEDAIFVIPLCALFAAFALEKCKPWQPPGVGSR